MGIQGRLIDFAQYLDPNFTWTAPNYLPWGGTHTGAVLFRDQVLSSLPDVFDFAQFSYVSVIAADGRVDAVINQGVRGTDAVIKIVDCWTVGDRQGHLDLGCLFRAPGAAREARHCPRLPDLFVRNVSLCLSEHDRTA